MYKMYIMYPIYTIYTMYTIYPIHHTPHHDRTNHTIRTAQYTIPLPLATPFNKTALFLQILRIDRLLDYGVGVGVHWYVGMLSHTPHHAPITDILIPIPILIRTCVIV